jgi:sugar phosphate isomerase/epimerase
MTRFPISAMLTSLPLPFAEAVRTCADLGFTHVDVVALTERPMDHREALADAELLVACAAVGRGLPEGVSLDAGPVEARRTALEMMKQHVADAAQLGATHAYIIPGTDASPAALERFAEGCALLATYAAGRMVRLCLEHIPGRALPTVATTLTWLERLNHDNLSLLLDVGHCLISGEDAAATVRQAGSRLGYVHLDDNDGVGDLHWPLLTGRLTEDALASFLAALLAAGYRGTLALELNPNNPDPTLALVAGKALVHQMVTQREHGESHDKKA